MEYYDQLSRLLVEEGVHPARARDIKENPRLLELFSDFLCDMMSLMCDFVGDTILLVVMRDGHAIDTSYEPSPSTTPSNHDDVVVMLSSTTPSF